MEEGHSLFAVSLAPVDETEVGDDLSFVLFFAELTKHRDRLLQVLDSRRFGAALSEGQPEVVECHCLGVLVAEVTNDLQRDSMLFDCLLRVASAPKLRSALVEAKRLAMPARGVRRQGGKSWDEPAAGLNCLRCDRQQPVHRDRIDLAAASQKCPSSHRSRASHVPGPDSGSS